MRFLFGIFVGAGVTLLVATAIDAPTNPIVERTADVWRELVGSTSRSLFPAPSAPAPLPARLPERPKASPEPAAEEGVRAPVSGGAGEDNAPAAAKQPGSKAVAVAAPSAAAAPASDLDAVAEQLIAAAGAELHALGQTTPRERVPEPSQQPPAEPPGGEPGTSMPIPSLTASAAGALPADALERARVWTPFRSERSARGFARRLSDQFQHPFSVERQGPGAYQVVFSYADPAERDALLTELGEITGQ